MLKNCDYSHHKRLRFLLRVCIHSFYFIGALLLFFNITLFRVEAKTTIVSPRTNILGETENSSITVQFKVARRQILQIPITARTVYSDVTSGGLRIQLKNVATGKLIQNDFMSWEYFGADENDVWFFSDGFYVDPGTYTYTLINSCPDDSEIKWAVYGFDGLAKSVKFNKKKKLKSGAWYKVGVVADANSLLPIEKSFSSSNNSRIHKNDISIDALGNIYVYAHKPGKVKITIKMRNGKKFKKTYTVTAPDPYFTAELMSYNTRNNYVTVKFRNYGIGNLKILSGGAKLISFDYKSFDRDLTNNAVTIKPNKSKTVKFYIDGSNTWSIIKDYKLKYRFSYYNKKHTGRAFYDEEDSDYKKGKKWYYTYWRGHFDDE